jgi:hypothetical protein
MVVRALVAVFSATTEYWPVWAAKICDPSGVTATPSVVSAETGSPRIAWVVVSTSATAPAPANEMKAW